MPLFELFGDSSRRKLDSNQEKPTDLSFIPESDFAELIWENGQVMVQGGQSSRGRKVHSLHGLPSYYNSPSQSPKHSRDRGNAVLEANNNGDGNENGVSSSSGRFRTFESGVNEFSAEMCDDDGDDDIVPWFNSPINDFLPELSGITENNFDWMKKNKETNLHTSANDGVSQVHFASFGAKGEATASATSTSNASCENTSQFPNSGNFVNFSYFSRPKSLNRSIGWNNSVIPNLDASSMERAAFSGKQEGPSAAVKQTNGSKSMESNRTEQPSCSKNCERIHPDDAPKIIGIRDKNGCGSTSRDTLDAVELVVASSVCSGNGLDGVLDYLACNLKKKSRDTYDSETPSDDIEEDSIVLRKAGTARGNSSKRGRAAEVHNLSERRRRDRINEKMRALQELIPNCNKVDKASMLDEAIEYLKTLQIQVQIMSMGAGLYMPPMMFSAGMNPAQIQAMGVGMASGFGSGIGSSGFPLMQIPPPMHFPSPYMSGHPAMHGALVPNYPFIGVPGLMSMQQWSPMVPFPVDTVPVHQPGSGTQSNGSVSGTTVCLKEPIVNADAAVRCSTNPPPSQGQQSLNGGGFEQSPCVQYIMNPIPDSSS